MAAAATVYLAQYLVTVEVHPRTQGRWKWQGAGLLMQFVDVLLWQLLDAGDLDRQVVLAASLIGQFHDRTGGHVEIVMMFFQGIDDQCFVGKFINAIG